MNLIMLVLVSLLMLLLVFTAYQDDESEAEAHWRKVQRRKAKWIAEVDREWRKKHGRYL